MSFVDRAISWGGSPLPISTRIVRSFLTRFPIGSFAARLRANGFARPWYAMCLYNAAYEAKALGHKGFTAIELGVAGGKGLAILCNYRDEIERETGLKINLIGLDAGTGLPETSDPRDLLYCWPAGAFKMDVPRLKAALAGRAEVILGNVAVTARELKLPPDAPLGAIFFDLDFYTSTRDAFALFDLTNILPRVWCYFDDVSGGHDNAYTDSIGVRAAIKEFKDNHEPLESHLSPAYAFKYFPPETWHQQIYLYHRVSHPDYNRCITPSAKHKLDLP